MPRPKVKASKEPDGDTVRVRLELDLAPGTLTLGGRLSHLDVRRGARSLDIRGRLGRIAWKDVVAEFRSRGTGEPRGEGA